MPTPTPIPVPMPGGASDVLSDVILIIMAVGVPWLSVKLYYWLESKPFPFLEGWSYPAKYTTAVLLAVILVTVAWAIGVVMSVYAALPPGASWQLWVRYWLNIVLPTAIIQQLWYGYDKLREAKAAAKNM